MQIVQFTLLHESQWRYLSKPYTPDKILVYHASSTLHPLHIDNFLNHKAFPNQSAFLLDNSVSLPMTGAKFVDDANSVGRPSDTFLIPSSARGPECKFPRVVICSSLCVLLGGGGVFRPPKGVILPCGEMNPGEDMGFSSVPHG